MAPIRDISLSADGKQVVVLRAIGDTYHATLTDLTTGKSRMLMAADPQRFLFKSCRFASASRVICRIASYGKAGGGHSKALLAINTDGTNSLQLVSRQQRLTGSAGEAEIISWLVDDPDHVLIQMPDRSAYPDVFQLNIHNNKTKRIRRYSNQVRNWIATAGGEITHAMGLSDATGEVLAWRVSGKQLKAMDLRHLAGQHPPVSVGYGPGGTSFYALANRNGADRRGLYRLDIDTGEVLETMLEHPQNDVASALVSGDGTLMSALVFSGKMETHWFDAATAAELERVKASLDDKVDNILIQSRSADFNTMVLYTDGARTPPTWYIYTRETPDQPRNLMRFDQAYTDIPTGEFALREAISYPARDGKMIAGYLTLPPTVDRATARPLPTVILPHGGPFQRDNSSFDYWSQAFAASGYAVLQPNFRGSTGYGDAFERAGFHQWGKAMQDDLDDGLAFLAAQGIADKDRACILGGSYGGYAALIAAIRNPDLYQCAVAFAPLTDMNDYERRLRGIEGIGYSDERAQRQVPSPLKDAAQIRLPLLLIHGDIDYVVRVSQSRKLVAALKDRDRTIADASPWEYLELVNGDHNLTLQTNRERFLKESIQFLARHLGR